MPCAALSSQVEGIAAQIGSGSSLLALSSHVEGVETSSWGIRRVGALSSHVEGVPPQTLPIAAGIGGQGTSGRYLLGLLFPAGSAFSCRFCCSPPGLLTSARESNPLSRFDRNSAYSFVTIDRRLTSDVLFLCPNEA